MVDDRPLVQPLDHEFVALHLCVDLELSIHDDVDGFYCLVLF